MDGVFFTTFKIKNRQNKLSIRGKIFQNHEQF